jgi:hypothetical protein
VRWPPEKAPLFSNLSQFWAMTAWKPKSRLGAKGHLRINGRDIARIDDAKDRRQAFREIKKIAERYAETHMSKNSSLRRFLR